MLLQPNTLYYLTCLLPFSLNLCPERTHNRNGNKFCVDRPTGSSVKHKNRKIMQMYTNATLNGLWGQLVCKPLWMLFEGRLESLQCHDAVDEVLWVWRLLRRATNALWRSLLPATEDVTVSSGISIYPKRVCWFQSLRSASHNWRGISLPLLRPCRTAFTSKSPIMGCTLRARNGTTRRSGCCTVIHSSSLLFYLGARCDRVRICSLNACSSTPRGVQGT